MAMTNQERVGKALDLLKAGLGPYVEREIDAAIKKSGPPPALRAFADDPNVNGKPISQWDVSPLLKVMWETWNEVFRATLGPGERGLVGEIRGHRNRWAHQEPFSSDDADRALDSVTRLLTAVSASQADDVAKMKMELRRLVFDEQTRSEKRKTAVSTVESQVTGTLKPWREVVAPHPDVASGRYQQAEFAADLWQVHLGQGSDEYRKPPEFFRRTFLTESLKALLKGAVLRLSGKGGDPVVQLQTNFGGGKTHSMLALYHLFSDVPTGELLGVDAVLQDAGVKKLPQHVKRVVIVGNKLSPGNPWSRGEGITVRTLWGEIAWQLGGRAAYERVWADDVRATNPGDVLRELMDQYGPCLILIDEWVAYARQLHDDPDLPGGSFETHFTFAQALTESAKLAKNCLLVISLPASDTATSPHAMGDDEEVGGERGRAALGRLRNVIGRVESSWAPASTEEGFEIVRRRLFEPLLEKAQFVGRDTVADAFHDLYRAQHQEFPPGCADSTYEKRLKAAYPIHPEVFDILYNDWSSQPRFQRTRGVLRLMAAVIHSLWEKGDRNPLIMPANMPIDDPRVRDELTRYLPDAWKPIIEKDVDGPNALPLQIDGAVQNLGKFAATRRVARAVYLGSAPSAATANRGVEDRRIKLGCVMPGESPSLFGDALRRLAAAATYLYQDGSRYWYSTQPTVTKMAEDRAEQLKRDPDKVVAEIEKRLRTDLRATGDFRRVHPLPHSGADVPDDYDARLVVLGVDYPHAKGDSGSKAEAAAKAIFETRGSAPRLFRNTLAFLAVDQVRLQDLDEAVRRYLAWDSIYSRHEELNLDKHQRGQADTQRQAADAAIIARLPEAYHWLLVPVQDNPHSPIKWESHRLTGNDALAVRAAKKLRNADLLYPSFGGTRLRMAMDEVPLWRDGHVSIKQLAEDFASYVYLPRLRDMSVLAAAIQDGLGLLLWDKDAFAYADSYDAPAQRYRGLQCGRNVVVNPDSLDGLLVKPDVAKAQQAAEAPVPVTPSAQTEITTTNGSAQPGTVAASSVSSGSTVSAPARQLRRFHGAASLNPARTARDVGDIANEVLAHLVGIVGAEVRVTLEIEAVLPSPASDHLVRTVTENCRTLKFNPNSGFEEE
jgi:predicted AAA+ superfamily ATPase